jgi:hypothetical protein
MKTKPTQIELATLAATLPNGTPADRVKLALAIWEEAAAETPTTAEWVGRKSAELESLSNKYPAPLESLLSELMPEKPKAYRLSKWEDFLTWKMMNARPFMIIPGKADTPLIGQKALFPEDTIPRADAMKYAGDLMRDHQDNGVKEFRQISREFAQWEESDRKTTLADRAKAAAEARWDREREASRSAGKPVPTAKKRTQKRKPKKNI